MKTLLKIIAYSIIATIVYTSALAISKGMTTKYVLLTFYSAGMIYMTLARVADELIDNGCK